MPTIKDVADLAGVSATTVSFVLNGKAREKKISQKTCERIELAMKEIGYRPNLSARRLRSSDGDKPIIAFYWPLDYRLNTLTHLINAIQVEMRRRSFVCEFIIQTYESNQLSESSGALVRGEYNGALIGGLGEKDIAFLESVPLTIPVVLINRNMEKLSTVSVNSRSLVKKAVALFENKGYQKLGVICSSNFYYATNQRTAMFMERIAERGMTIPKDWIIRVENRINGGVRAGRLLFNMSDRPRGVYCDSDAIAYGLIYYCNRHAIRVPQDLEILSVGSLFDNGYAAYATPSISVIALPHNRIAASAISLLIDALAFGSTKPQHILIEPDVQLRDSFPEE